MTLTDEQSWMRKFREVEHKFVFILDDMEVAANTFIEAEGTIYIYIYIYYISFCFVYKLYEKKGNILRLKKSMILYSCYK